MPVILPITDKNRAIQTFGTIIGIDKYAFSFQYLPQQIFVNVPSVDAFLKEQLTSCEVMLQADQNRPTETFVITNV